MLCVCDSDNRVKAHILLELGDIQEGLRDRARISHSSSFNQNVIEVVLLEQLLNTFYEVLAYGAPNAAVAHLQNIFGLRLYKFAVDANLADLINNHPEPVVA